MKISALLNAYNDEQELPSLIENLKGVDEIVVVDHNPDKNTYKVAQDLGVKAYFEPNTIEAVTKKDIKQFKKQMGYQPHFTEGQELFDSAAGLNKGLLHITNDWVLVLDCDERVKWNIPKLKKELDVDIIKCTFVNQHNQDGTPKSSFPCKKLFRKSKACFVCRVHQMPYGHNLKEKFSNNITIHHWQKPMTTRDIYIHRIEHAFLKEQSSRMNFYLGREYYHLGEWEKCIKALKLYLKSSIYPSEIGHAFLLMAGSLWETERYEESFEYLFKSMRAYPYSKLPFLMMAKMTEVLNPKDAQVWFRITDQIQELPDAIK